MPIGSIAIAQDPVVGVATFSDNLIAGKDSAWAPNSYSHEIRAMGGFWKCRFDILPNKLGIEYLEEYLESGLGRIVTSYLLDGGIAWQGKIVKLSLAIPGSSVVVSLEDMTNKTWVRYLTSEGGLIKRSTVQEDSVSQTRFGIKEVVNSGAIIPSSTIADQVATSYLAEYADPTRTRLTIQLGTRQEQEIKLTVFCEGYFKTLNWRTYNKVTAHALQNVSTQIADINTAVGQFIASTDIETNTTQVSQEYDRDELAGNAILDLARLADSSDNRYIVGVYEGRVLKYEQAKTFTGESETEYNFRMRDKAQVLRERGTDRELSPASIRPNEWLNVLDLFPGRLADNTDLTKDPRITYVESVIYQEPIGLTIPSNRAGQLDNLLAKSGFGGASQI